MIIDTTINLSSIISAIVIVGALVRFAVGIKNSVNQHTIWIVELQKQMVVLAADQREMMRLSADATDKLKHVSEVLDRHIREQFNDRGT